MTQIDFLTYSSRSGSTFLARLIDHRYNVLVVPETQCSYHALTMAPGTLITPERAVTMIKEDVQLYWFDDHALELLRHGAALSPGTFMLEIARGFAHHSGRRLERHVLFKLGGALHIWDDIRRWLPHARAVDVVRDGRAVVSSALRAEAPYLKGLTLALNDPVRGALTWRRDYLRANAVSSRWPGSVHQVRYEHLVADPERVLSPLGNWAGWAPGGGEGFAVNPSEAKIHSLVAQDAQGNRVDGWTSELKRRDRIVVERICRDQLNAYGVTDFLKVSAPELAATTATAWAYHLMIGARSLGPRLRRIHSCDEFRRKLVYRFSRSEFGRRLRA